VKNTVLYLNKVKELLGLIETPDLLK